VLEEEVPLDDVEEEVFELEPDDEEPEPESDEDDDEDEPEEEDDASDLAGTVLLPELRLSLR